ncbi:MAG: tRNA (uridine(34)/cytosine(34)/5-carboxymethylaminomethyluridine(34)-2'-O)-methyltransferase TrmL [Clostridia bacterium]|nr:tRNA (uridine(34)/cytosine(34)/5-carboxymethylaminomethyluridine(34)-2'-O)-methyltransferase TrmL [Clostridia bacterium]
MKLNIVLVEPEIPQNTGNIARTCAVINADLHLVKPLGFDISEKAVRRAGLDYWDKVNVYTYESLEEFKEYVKDKNAQVFLLTTKGKKVYSRAEFKDGDFLVFGPETRGLPEKYILENFERALRVPMGKNLRSLNLSNTVALVAYEALRQNDFDGLEEESMYFTKKGEIK